MPRPRPRGVGFDGQARHRFQYVCLLDEFLGSHPFRLSVASALKTLFLLEALDVKKELTPVGRQMAAFPLEPTHARAVLASKERACTSEVLDIISVLSASSKLFLDVSEQREAIGDARRKFAHPSGDHFTVLNTVRAYQEVQAEGGKNAKGARKDWCRKHWLNERTLTEALEIRDQLRVTCHRLGIDWKVSCGDQEEPVILSLAEGLAQNSAFLQTDGSYKQTMGQSVRGRR